MKRRGLLKNLIAGAVALAAAAAWLSPVDFAAAHHVLGRPGYSLNEDSNTPPSLQGETRLGGYFVTYMVFPAFPEPGKPGKIYLYATRIDDGTPYLGTVAFSARRDSWLSWLGTGNAAAHLGVQPPDDNVYRQGYEFHEAGDYIITAEFEADGEPHVHDVPLRIGVPMPVGRMVGGVALILLVTVSVVYRRRAMTAKIRGAHEYEQRDGT